MTITSAIQTYARSLTFDQIVANLEFIGNSFFFSATKAFKGFKKADWDWLADAVSFQALEAVQSVPLSMHWMGKKATFSKQKYLTIRNNLEAIGCFKVEASHARRGPKQAVTNLLDMDFRLLVELVRELYEQSMVIMVDFESHPLFPRHQFAFLMRWHTKVFGFRPDDRERTDEMKALALGDRNEYWRRGLYHEQFEAFAHVVESEYLVRDGWSEQTKQDIREYLAYPEVFDFERWGKMCPDISRLSPEEIDLTNRLRTAIGCLKDLQRGTSLPTFGIWFKWFFNDCNELLVIQNCDALLVALRAAYDYAMDPVNGIRNGRPIEHAHQWAWEFAKTKLVGS